jgi:hypothetical protein
VDEAIKVYVGLDVHKESIEIAAADIGRAEPRALGRITHDIPKLLRVLGKLAEPHAVHVVYEAGPTGYGLQRELAARGYHCQVIAPSLVPKRPGEHIKTDRRDCLNLARLSRNGDLTAIWVPDTADEAIRDVARAREDAVNARSKARQHLRAFLLRHSVRYSAGKKAWTKMFYRWLGTVIMPNSVSQMAFVEYRLAVQAADERVERLTGALTQSICGWRFEPVVAALRALRGVDSVVAIGLVVEVGDISRFDHPRKLMAYLGMVPREHSSGERTQRGSITMAGNTHARKLLIEAAWNYRFRAKIGRQAQARQEDLPAPVREIAWKAQVRLCDRFMRLSGRGLHQNKACVAVARELTGFVWAIARIGQPAHAG